MTLINWEINCEMNLMLTSRAGCVLSTATEGTTFAISDNTLRSSSNVSIQNNGKLMQQLKSSFKRSIDWNKFYSRSKNKDQILYWHHSTNPMVQGMIRLFVLPFEDDAHRTRHTGFLLPKVKKKKITVLWLMRGTFLINLLKKI